MKKKKVDVGKANIQVLGVLVLIVFLSACIESPTGEKTVTERTVPATEDYGEYEEEYQKEMDEIRGSFLEGETDGKVAVLRIYGILDVEDLLPIMKTLREIEETDAKGAILWIDSPGGSVAAVTQITYEILRFKEKKPIVAYIGGYGASGAYYISSVCDKIVARGDATVGSIGVIYVHVDASEYYGQFGYKLEIIKTGKHKDAGADWRSLTEEERSGIEASVSDAYSRFIFTVAKGRGLSYDHVEKYADGSVWDGKDCLNAELIDALGNFDTAIKEINALTGLKNPEIIFIEEESAEEDFDTSESWESLRYQLPSTLREED
ncbi:MAG: signal peptide peptidase SppA [Euryarchaeota archaeon]|nr:signal peptide peptidase SppA [Euryarchaeota archaeon]